MKSFETFCEAVLKEIRLHFGYIYPKETLLEITYPFIDPELPLMILTIPDREQEDYPVTIHREDTKKVKYYHDKKHMIDVAGLALHYYYQETLEEALPIEGAFLFLSGIFHDLEHSLGLETDDINVSKTIARVQELLVMPSPFNNIILNAIQATQYPKVVEPNSLIESCLVDADLTAVTFGKKAAVDIIDKLLAEINRARVIKDLDPITPKEMYKNQKEFKEHIQLNTQTAKTIYAKYADALLEELKEMTKDD